MIVVNNKNIRQRCFKMKKIILLMTVLSVTMVGSAAIEINPNIAVKTKPTYTYYTPGLGADGLPTDNKCKGFGTLFDTTNYTDVVYAIGEYYTLSFDFYWEGFLENKDPRFMLWLGSEGYGANGKWSYTATFASDDNAAIFTDMVTNSYSGEYHYSYSAKFPTSRSQNVRFRVDYANGKGRIGVKNVKLEKGKKDTPWCPRWNEMGFVVRSSDDRFASRVVSASINGAEIEGDGAAKLAALNNLNGDNCGDDISITVEGSDEAMFNGWMYYPKGAVTNGNTLSWTVAVPGENDPRTNDVVWFASPNWTYHESVTYDDRTFPIISNKVWTIRVYDKTDNEALADDELGVGRFSGTTAQGYSPSTNNYVNNSYPYGSGMLDLSGKITAKNGDELKIVEIPAQCFGCPDWLKNTWVPPIGEFVFPRTVREVGIHIFNTIKCKDYEGAILLTNVYAYCPDLVNWRPGYAFNSGVSSARAYFNLPKLPEAEGGSICQSFGLNSDYDISNWNFNSLTNIGAYGFKDVKGKGTLSFPSLQIVSTQGIRSASIDELRMGEGYKISDRKTLVVKQSAFSDMNSLTNMVFGPYAGIVSDIAEGKTIVNTVIPNLLFTGRPVSAKFLSDILTKVTSVEENTVIIRASRRLGWDKIAGLQTDYTAYEEYAPQVEVDEKGRGGILGVYKVGDVAKAWIVDEPSLYDPRGTVIILR